MSKGADKRIVLSLGKLTSLLSKYLYTLVSTYCVGSDVQFIEARTPRLQKTFVIYVPSKYKMRCDDENYKRFQITPVSFSSMSRQLDYLMEIKGPLIDCDLLSISSSMLCLHKNSGDTLYYKIGDYTKTNNDGSNEEQELNSVEQIQKDVEDMMKKVEPEAAPPEEPDELFLTPEDLKQMTLVESKDEPQVELEFEDASGDPIDESLNLMADNTETPNLTEEDVDKVGTQTFPSDKNTSGIQRKDNSLPPSLEDSDISLGIVYYSIDIAIFYKRISTLEDDMISIYNTLDDNEDDLRETKITEIILLTEKIVQKAKTEMEKIKKREAETKSQLITLSAILDKTDTFQTRMEKDKKKFADIKQEIDRIQMQTKTTIYDINVELLRIRDTMDDLLDGIQTSLEEILSM